MNDFNIILDNKIILLNVIINIIKFKCLLTFNIIFKIKKIISKI